MSSVTNHASSATTKVSANASNGSIITGTGKTRQVEEAHPTGLFKKLNDKEWWDGYRHGDVVLVDDLMPIPNSKEGLARLGDLKRWFSQYPFNMEVKNGNLRNQRFAKGYVTSNYHPAEILAAWDEREVAAVSRRFQIIYVGPLGGEYKGPRATVNFTPPTPSTQGTDDTDNHPVRPPSRKPNNNPTVTKFTAYDDEED